MANNATTDKVTKDQTGAETKAAPFSFSRFFNRNGHRKTPPPETQPGPPKTFFREYFESAVVTVIMALFGMTFIVQAVKVPTSSMQNTILIGDHLLINKFIFAPGESLPFLPQREIQRGDVIVFKYPGNKYDPESDLSPENTPYLTNYVKRVIGLPGDRIRIEGQNVIVNDEIIPEHRIAVKQEELGKEKAALEAITDQPPAPPKPEERYTVYYRSSSGHDDPRERNVFEDKEELIVPPSSYFVLGDNRSNSQDSRFWGFVPRDLVIGRAMFVYWSYNESAPPSGGGVIVDFFKNTRWTRTGTLVR